MRQPDSAKHHLLEQFARIGKAVSSPTRLELLDLLAQGEKSVETLARQAGLSVTNTSNHLKELRTCGLVVARKGGAYVYYQLADLGVHEFLRSLQNVARRHLAEARQTVQDYFEAADTLEPLGATELLARMRSDDVVIVDVRPEDEYGSAHIPGALSIPVSELEQRLSELTPEKEIVAYCRGPYCIMSLKAVAILRSRGFRVRRLADGVPDWRLAGYDVSRGAEHERVQ